MQKLSFSKLCNFTPMQWRATSNCDALRYFLYGGRRGVLKSYWLRWYGLRRLLKWGMEGHRNVRLMLACEDYPTLIDRQVNKIYSEFPKWLGEVKTTKIDGFGFHIRPEYGAGKLCFRSLDKPQKYRGSEWAAILIDELTKHQEFVEPEIRFFDVLDGSLRWPGLSDAFFAATSNPDGIGQVWVREFFVEKKLPENRMKAVDKFGYLQGVREKTSYLDQSYWDAIESVGSKLKAAWVDADWYVDFSGYLIRRSWFQFVKRRPSGLEKVVRYWDKAGTAGSGTFTVGLLMGRKEQRYYVLDVVRGQWASGERDKIIKQTSIMDKSVYGSKYYIWHEQEPGSGGKESAESTTRMLAGFNVKADKVTKAKDSRDRGLEPFAAQAEASNVFLVEGRWNADYLDELSVVPHSKIRDQADATGGAFNKLTKSSLGIYV